MPAAVDYVGFHARSSPSRFAACDLATGRRYSYELLNRTVGQFAQALIKRGLTSGDRVAMLARNRVECVITHLACARAGLIYVPLNWRLAPSEIAVLLADAAPALLLGDDCLLAANLSGTPIEEFSELAQQLDPLVEAPICPEDPSLILYTSGTSGRPKGAVLSERNLSETAINFSLLGRVEHSSVFLCDAPMFHVIGLVTNIRPVLLQGGAFLVSDGFVPSRTLQRLGDPDLGVTHYFCVPQMAAALKAEPSFDPSQLRRLVAIFTGGAPHPAANIRAWLKTGIAVVDGAGMSEAGTIFGMPLEIEAIDRRAGSVGIATPRVQTRIVDALGGECPVGVPGELLLKGANVSRGYWNKPSETNEAFTDDGWFRTGDIVRADEKGYHWIVDRRKDMFISGGENVYPAEIETVLAGHPEVAECAVVGVQDERWGEVGHLFLVMSPGATSTAESILAYLAGSLARFKVPKHVSFIAALPRNGAGKVVKSLLLRQLDSEQSME